MVPSRGEKIVHTVRLLAASKYSNAINYVILHLVITQTCLIPQCLASIDFQVNRANHAPSIILQHLTSSADINKPLESAFHDSSADNSEDLRVELGAPVPVKPVKFESDESFKLVKSESFKPVEPDKLAETDDSFEPAGSVLVYNATSLLRRERRQQTGKRERPQPESGNVNRIVCYACMFMLEDGHEQGNAFCDDPFQQYDIPMISCSGPCGKIYRKLDDKGSFSLKRDCVHNCKEMEDEAKGYTKCCNGLLCNSAHTTYPFYHLSHIRSAFIGALLYSTVCAYIVNAYFCVR